MKKGVVWLYNKCKEAMNDTSIAVEKNGFGKRNSVPNGPMNLIQMRSKIGGSEVAILRGHQYQLISRRRFTEAVPAPSAPWHQDNPGGGQALCHQGSSVISTQWGGFRGKNHEMNPGRPPRKRLMPLLLRRDGVFATNFSSQSSFLTLKIRKN